MATVKALIPQKETEVKRIRVAAYCRVSTDSADQKDSFDAQVEYYTHFIGDNPNWTLADIYADQGISGTSMANREEFNRMIADCQRGKIDRVITKSVSRFARNTVDCLETVRMLSALGITVLFQKEQIDTADMSSEFILALAGIQAQDESVSISGNMRWSYEERMKRGDFLGCKPPYGYTLQNGALVINQEEAAVVRLIYEMYLSGTAKYLIASYLNEKGVPKPYGFSTWHHFTVDYILNNEKYIGDALLQKKYTTQQFPFKKERNTGQRPQYYVENSHQPIISREAYQAAQMMQQRRRKAIVSERHFLSGRIICSECGHTFRRFRMGNEFFWQCAYRSSGRSDCHPIYINENDLIVALTRLINLLRENLDGIIAPTIKMLELLQCKANGTQVRIYEIDKAIAEINNQIHLLTQLQIQGILDPADFTAQNHSLSEKTRRLRAERMKILRCNEHDDSMVALKNTAEILSDTSLLTEDNTEMTIQSVVSKIIILSASDVEIEIAGGLTFTEQLPCRKRRVKYS